MAKIKSIHLDDEGRHTLQFLCPACKFNSGKPFPHNITWKKDSDSWTFDENYESPTITPSVAVTGFKLNDKDERVQTLCHSFITKGKINFCGDCTHDLKGQTVELPEIE